MKYETDKSGAVVIKTTLGEILFKLAILDNSEVVTTSVTRSFSKKESTKIIKELLQYVTISIPKQDVEEALKKLGEGRNLYVTNMMKHNIEKFFKRDE